jgi:hypothetical protein
VVPHRVGADALFRPGRKLDDDFLEAEIAVDRHHQVVDLQALASSCSSVQNTCASSWVKPRTRISPCSAPDGS